LTGWAWAGAPLAVAPSADEAAALARGEVVVREPDASGELVGWVDVAGDAPAIWDAIFDWDLRVRTVSSIASIDVYAPESDPGGLGATFRLSVLGSTLTYHLRYTVDRAGGWCTFTLDPQRTHDIAGTWGSYRIDPLPAGNRLTYRSRTDAGRAVPATVRNWLAVRSVRDQLVAMQARAGGPAR
ncbi:MAG: hypothetical protein ABMA64_03670, partial [Myxococcota bacterium]